MVPKVFLILSSKTKKAVAAVEASERNPLVAMGLNLTSILTPTVKRLKFVIKVPTNGYQAITRMSAIVFVKSGGP